MILRVIFASLLLITSLSLTNCSKNPATGEQSFTGFINPNREKDQEIINTLLYYDFIFDKKQVDNSTRIDGPHKGYAEYLFYRK